MSDSKFLEVSESELRRVLKWREYQQLSKQPSVIRLIDMVRRTPVHDRKMHADAMARVLSVRIGYQWPWGPGPEYLYLELIRASGLQSYEAELLNLAKPSRGRKLKIGIDACIQQLKRKGKTALETKEILEQKGVFLSPEGIESYRKSRRTSKRSPK